MSKPSKKKAGRKLVFQWVWRCRRAGMETPRRDTPVEAARDIPDNPCSSCRVVPVKQTELRTPKKGKK